MNFMKKSVIRHFLVWSCVVGVFTTVSVRGDGTGCYKVASVPCDNAPSMVRSCDVPDGSGGTKKQNKTVWFVITAHCKVWGNEEVPRAGSGSTTSGVTELEPSVNRPCQASGYYPDCNNNPTETETITVHCNTQLPQANAPGC